MCRSRKYLDEKGFTLLEIMIVLGILSYLLVQAFQVLDVNFELVDKEIAKKDAREEFRMFSSFMVQDVMLSPEVNVYHGNGYDSLTFINIDGVNETVEFNHTDGIFQYIDGERKLVSKGERIREDSPMVMLMGPDVVYNFHSKQINTTLDLTIRRRIAE